MLTRDRDVLSKTQLNPFQKSSNRSHSHLLDLLCGMDHRQAKRRRATTPEGDSPCPIRKTITNSSSKRLASDLKQLAKDTLNPDLKAHCVRTAKHWSGEADAPAKAFGLEFMGADRVLH